MTTSTITRGGLTLCKFEQLTPLVGLYLDHGNTWRLLIPDEAGRGFRGYASQQADGTWNVLAFSRGVHWRDQDGYGYRGLQGRRSFRRAGYRTEAGAINALRRFAPRIEG
jgi:hypothetical protein